MRVFAPSNHEVVLLVMHASRHYTDEAETLKLSEILGWDTNFKDRPFIDVLRGKMPTPEAVHGRGMGRSHPPDRIGNGSGAGDDETYAAR